MTKNHILIKSIALGVSLMLSTTAQAVGGVDQVLVTYFNKLYGGASPKCTIDLATKTRILAEIEPKCLIRTVKDEGSYISGVKSVCTEASVKTAVDSQVNALCENSAFKADQAAQLKLQQQAVAQQQAAAAGKSASGGGGSGAASTLQQVAQGLKLYNDISSKSLRVEKAVEKAKDKLNIGEKKPETATASTTSKPPDNPSAGGGATATPINNPSAYVAPSNTATPSGGNGSAAAPVNNPSAYVAPSADNKAPGASPTPATTTPAADIKPGDAEALRAAEQPKIDQATRNVTGTPAEAPAKETNAPANPDATDPELVERHAKSKAEDSTLMTKLEAIKAKIRAGAGAIPGEATAKASAEMGMGPASVEMAANLPQALVTCLNTQITELDKDKVELQKDKESCSNAAAQAEKLCSMVRSEKAQNVQKLMSIGATVLSKVTAASESCGTTSDISKIAQGGMLLAQGACTTMKFRCDFSCNSAKKTLEAMKVKIAAMEKCPKAPNSAQVAGQQVDLAVKEFKIEIEQELTPEKSVPSAIAQCQQHKVDIALMGVAALGFLSAHQDAESCKKQLAAGDANTAGKSTSSLAGPNMSTAEYCSTPGNATSLTCKCTTNPNADGCIGSLAKSGVNLGKIGSGSGASAFASAKQNGLSSLQSSGKAAKGTDEETAPPPGANLSEAAREALGLSDSPAGTPGSGVGSNSPEAAQKGKDKEEKEKPKFGFFSSLGNMMSGGRKPDQAANATIRKHEQDQAIKRKLASDQVRAEISTASGKSNFDKIRSRYQQNAASFEQ